MAALVPFGLWDNSEPTTKHDGLLWITPMLELAVWYNGQWRSIRNTSLQAYGATTPVPTPANAATTLVGTRAANPAPQVNGRLLFNTGTLRIDVWDSIGWVQIP